MPQRDEVAIGGSPRERLSGAAALPERMSVLATKLRLPSPRRRLVRRDRIIDQLRVGAVGSPRLVLIAAPAGFGKTTLLAQWLAAPRSSQHRVAWLALDSGDDDLRLFLTHLYFARRCREPQTVADLTSETIVRAVSGFAGYDPPRGPARAWLLGIASRVFAGHCERLASGRGAVVRFEGHRVLDADDVDELTERIDAGREGAELLRRCAQLPAHEREVIELSG